MGFSILSSNKENVEKEHSQDNTDAVRRVRGRRVSFSESDNDEDVTVNIYPINEDLTDVETSKLWYNKNEIDEILESAKIESVMCQSDVKLKKNLVEAHKACIDFEEAGTSKERKLTPNREGSGSYKISGKDKVYGDVAKEKILKWAMNPKACRGLESWSCNELEQLRRIKRSAVIYSVLNEQDATFMEDSSGEHIAEQLRSVSENLSSYAKRFALVMGQVDAMDIKPEGRKSFVGQSQAMKKFQMRFRGGRRKSTTDM